MSYSDDTSSEERITAFREKQPTCRADYINTGVSLFRACSYSPTTSAKAWFSRGRGRWASW